MGAVQNSGSESALTDVQHQYVVRFLLSDLRLFSDASGDRNPCHVSSEHARTTPYGQLLVNGILAALAGLGGMELVRGSTLSRVSLEYRQAMFPDIDYTIILSKPSPGTASMKLCDGSKVLMTGAFEFSANKASEVPWGEPPVGMLKVPAERQEDEFVDGAVIAGEYLPDRQALSALLSRFKLEEGAVGRLQLSTLFWSSYFVGMVQPGLRSMSHKFSFSFEPLSECRSSGLSYEAKVISLNAFGSLRSGLRVFSGPHLVGTGESRAFLLPRRRVGSIRAVEAALPRSERMKGKVALVVGASRGLGSMLTAALALQGCTVLANFERSEPQAQRLRESLADSPGRVILSQGDASDAVWCESLAAQVRSQFGRLDFLICSACPPPLPLRLELPMVSRINSYVARALALVTVPLSAFSQLLQEKTAWSVLISSEFVETAPEEWPQYVALKCAVEGLVRVAARQYPSANYLIVRPPKLETDMTNRPSRKLFGQDSTPPELVAAKTVERLLRDATERVEVLTP